MPLLFSRLCDLFSDLEGLHKRRSPLPAATLRQESNYRVNQWCKSLSLSINSTDVNLLALLSALFPKKRTDRVYGIQPRSLSRKLKRILGLGNGRHQLLDGWQEPGRGDLGACVERALQQAEFPLQPRNRQITIEEIDTVLATIAAGYRFSGPKVRAAAAGAVRQDDDELLVSLYQRMQSREAKWLTRMILKDYGPVDIPEWVVFRTVDAQMPIAMKIHDTFEDAISLLRSGRLLEHGTGLLPRVGVKVGRVNYAKARSVKHAVSIIQNRKMSVERKYDGEYCQVHIDISGTNDQIQIFSKSGKDSTADRVGLHETLKKCLKLTKEGCAFKSKCILEGEMVIWSDREAKILEFHKIRKHVSRSGSFLGTSVDSLPHRHEHLMILFYDILLVDESSCLQLPHTSRRRLLNRVVTEIPGRAELAFQRLIDFSSSKAPEELREQYAYAIANRWEGLVLKPLDEPYFGTAKTGSNLPRGCWLKLKKDYIAGLGDTADFAVIGAGYCAKAASRCMVANIKWTHFHIGCLKNKNAVINIGARPEYLVLDAIHESLSVKDLTYLNQHGQFYSLTVGSPECKKAVGLDFASWEGPQMAVAFRKPFVFEIMGGGFVKLPNSEHYALRWPRVQKIHQDRTWKDSIGVDELQRLAIEANSIPNEEDIEHETTSWRRRLEDADRGARKAMLPWDDSQEYSASESKTTSTPRPRRTNRKSVPPLVRVDTAEMAPDEQRLASGEVVHRPASSGSIFSRGTASSLPTPPTSSPGGKQNSVPINSENNFQLETNSSLRKRPIEDPRHAMASRKKPRNVEQDGGSGPLLESLNSANRTRRATPISAPSIAANASVKPFLVRKVPPGADGLPLKSRIKKPTRVLEPRTPSQQTATTERTSGTTSCSAKSSARAGCSPLDPTSVRNDSGRPSSPKPAAIEPNIEDSPLPNIPNLSSCPVMLSPCISRIPYLLENLLPGRVHNIIPLPQYANHTPLPTPPPTNSVNGQTAVLLIESKRHEQSSRLMLSVLPHLHQAPYKRIDVWDWTLLELVSKGETNTERMARRFFGSMWWDARACEVVVQWQDGLLMRLRIGPNQETHLIHKSLGKKYTEDRDAEVFDNRVIRHLDRREDDT